MGSVDLACRVCPCRRRRRSFTPLVPSCDSVGIRQLEGVSFSCTVFAFVIVSVDVPREHFILCVIRHDKAGLSRMYRQSYRYCRSACSPASGRRPQDQGIDADKLVIVAAAWCLRLWSLSQRAETRSVLMFLKTFAVVSHFRSLFDNLSGVMVLQHGYVVQLLYLHPADSNNTYDICFAVTWNNCCWIIR